MSRVVPLLLFVGALVSAACLGDLEEPLTCPPGPQTVGAAAACVSTIGEDPNVFDEDFCLVGPEALACYREPARTCTCGEDACPAASDSCNPAPDCPAEVAERFPTARCIRLDEADVGPFQTASDQCLCGCERCLITCDGRGPIWSQADLADAMGMPATPGGLLTVDVQRHFPDRGQAGVYVRARGLTTSVGNSVDTSPPAVLGFTEGSITFTIGALPALMSDRFETRIYPEEAPMSWSDPGDKPTLVAFSNALNAFSLYEIDCVIPFVVE